MPSEARVIDSGLTGPINHDILDSVIGQLSDGKWENSPVMVKFWKNAKIEERDGKIVIIVKDGWDSGFRGKDDAWVKSWFAGKIKDIAYDEYDGAKWDRKDSRELGYLSRRDEYPVKVSDAYKAYEILKGRKVDGKYAEPAPAAPKAPAPAAPAPATPRQAVDRLLDEPDVAVPHNYD